MCALTTNTHHGCRLSTRSYALKNFHEWSLFFSVWTRWSWWLTRCRTRTPHACKKMIYTGRWRVDATPPDRTAFGELENPGFTVNHVRALYSRIQTYVFCPTFVVPHFLCIAFSNSANLKADGKKSQRSPVTPTTCVLCIAPPFCVWKPAQLFHEYVCMYM